MFDSIKDFINKYVTTKDTEIIIESEIIHGKNKLEYALCKGDFMASMSILSDFTYDFFATEIENEKMIMAKTMYLKDIDELFKQIEEDMNDFSDLKK